MRLVFSLGIVRGLIGQLIGTAVGMLLVTLLRAILGKDPVWAPEPAVALGALLGVMGFMLGVGAVTDWLKWMRGEETPFHHGPPEDKPAWTRYFGTDYSHKVIGIQYTVTGILVVIIAGTLALIFRTELAHPGMQFLDPHTFNTYMSTHGIAMIAGILLGVAGMMNYLVPLMIGASDMAFPRLNAFAYWINVPGLLLVIASLFTGGWDTGWTGYPPLGTRAPLGMLLVYLGVYVIGLSSILGALNILATVFTMRAPGMTLFRMPIFVWASVATSIIALTATQLIGLSFIMVVAERVFKMYFFTPILTESAKELGSPRATSSSSSTCSGSTPTPQFMCSSCRGWGSLANCCPCLPASRCSATSGLPCLVWALPWWASSSGPTTCSRREWRNISVFP